MGNGMYTDQSTTQHALSPEDIIPLSDHSIYQSDLPVSIPEDQLAQTQSLQGLHVQKQPARLSSETQSSDAAQNTCLPVVGQPERKSLGEDSVNDYAVKQDDTMDEILRFLLKVMVGRNKRVCVCSMYLCMTISCAELSAALSHVDAGVHVHKLCCQVMKAVLALLPRHGWVFSFSDVLYFKAFTCKGMMQYGVLWGSDRSVAALQDGYQG